MEYSLNQIGNIRQAILQLLDKGTESKFKTKLIYALRKNLKKIDEEIELVREQFKDSVEDFQEFQNKRFELAQEHGGEVETQGQQSYIANPKEVLDSPDYEKDLEELKEEYKEAIEEQEKVVEHNQKKAEEAVIEIDWYDVRLDFFNEEHFANELPQELLDLIKE